MDGFGENRGFGVDFGCLDEQLSSASRTWGSARADNDVVECLSTGENNAIGRVRLSVRLFLLYLLNQLT